MQASDYFKRLFTVLETLEITDDWGEYLDFEAGIQKIMVLLKGLTALDNKIIFVGNGGSCAIASHMALDYWNNGGILALCLNEGAQLTCMGNDLGYENVFARPVSFFARKGDVLVAISSSGRSANILKAVEAAVKLECSIITLSGFSPQNPLRYLGSMNIYSPSCEYGLVESSHQLVLHMILDLMSTSKEKSNGPSK